ncbi:ABC transporter permease [Solemya velesiana gill symbiont]|uniref:Peptide ABC transporter permease n=1 Tax=Solemya velesiana gill symbiont TaxID=1918948 RepID=A0A1T2KS67_9GAMM|nr:ABC transporter permease [Solemya velesiana gill symbiont]OOZ35672.1 peptide ABC transporter permease [Solemya velesiana gill symbiont]
MLAEDILKFGSNALSGARTRTWLMLLAMAIGIGSVVVLTALGEGARRYVSNEFSNLGTNLIVVLPGRTETTGGAPPIIGGTPEDLTLNDALALLRSSSVRKIAPVVIGSAPVSHQQLEREVTVVGSTYDLLHVRNMAMALGEFLPPGDPTRGGAVVVIGTTLKEELFGNKKVLGEWIRIHDSRFRIIGVLQPLGESLGMDVGDLAIIPVSRAQSLFNTESLFRILVQANGREDIPKAQQAIKDILRERHDGEEDVTIITQDALLSTFDEIFQALTATVAGIAAISLGVAGILIMNVMLVAVSQRTTEIGLLKALGSSEQQIMQLFLVEAALLSTFGALIGVAVAYAGVWGLNQVFPDFPLFVPLWALAAALMVALITGLLFGVMPAKRAARLDPVQALSGR